MPGEYPFAGGPYLSAAFLCEKVLNESDGVKSIIRIVDRFVQSAVGPNPPPELIPFEHSFVLFLRFKSGRARGLMGVKFELIKPSGEALPPGMQNVLFEGEDDGGVEIAINMKLRLDQTGIWWFYIYLNDVRVTQIPFKVIYMPQVRQVSGSGNMV